MRDATKLHVSQVLNIKPGVRKYPSMYLIIGHYHALWNFLYVHMCRKKYPNRLQVVRRLRCSRVWVNMLPALTYQLLMKIRYVYNCICSPHKLLYSAYMHNIIMCSSVFSPGPFSIAPPSQCLQWPYFFDVVTNSTQTTLGAYTFTFPGEKPIEFIQAPGFFLLRWQAHLAVVLLAPIHIHSCNF